MMKWMPKPKRRKKYRELQLSTNRYLISNELDGFKEHLKDGLP
jgi:hypothetical protein